MACIFNRCLGSFDFFFFPLKPQTLHPILNRLFLGLLGLVPCASYIFLKTFCPFIFRVTSPPPPPAVCKGCALCLQGKPQILDSITSYKLSTCIEVHRKVESLLEHGKREMMATTEDNRSRYPVIGVTRVYSSSHTELSFHIFRPQNAIVTRVPPQQDSNTCGLVKGTEVNQSGDGVCFIMCEQEPINL